VLSDLAEIALQAGDDGWIRPAAPCKVAGLRMDSLSFRRQRIDVVLTRWVNVVLIRRRSLRRSGRRNLDGAP
jgi:hypothetical protein